MRSYKLSIFFGVLFLISSCAGDDASSKTQTKPSVTTSKDSVKRTAVSVGSGGAALKSEKLNVDVNGSGVKVGTKEVKVDVKK